MPREVDRTARSARSILSKREFEIAQLLAGGQTRPVIAKSLGISENTVATICKRIHAKLGVHRRAELTARLKDA